MSDLKQKIGRRFSEDQYENVDIYERLIACKVHLLKTHPFWGVLLMNLRILEINAIPTCATDGRNMFYNSSFVKSLSNEELIFVMAHEVYHCLLGHVLPIRILDRDRHVLNAAQDFAINGELKSVNIGQMPKMGLYDEKYAGMSSEEIYDILMQNPEEAKKYKPIDIHIEVTEDGTGDGSEDGEPKVEQNADGSYTIKISKEQFEKNKKTWNNSIYSAASIANNSSNSAGSIPKGLSRLISSLGKHKVNWKLVLRRYISKVLQKSYSFMKPNKNLFNYNISVPGFRNRLESANLAISIDASGSVSEAQLSKGLSEVNGILKSFPRYELLSWCFDGDVIEDSYTKITKKSSNTLDSMKPFLKKLSGGGGTDFVSNWQWMKKKKIKPKLLIMFTDGYPCGEWGEPYYCPTIFVICNNGDRSVKAPFGTTLYIE